MMQGKHTELLVIGGSGFIGAKLVEAALHAGRSVGYTYNRNALLLPAPSFQVDVQTGRQLEDCIAETNPHAVVYCAMPQPGSDARLHEEINAEREADGGMFAWGSDHSSKTGFRAKRFPPGCRKRSP